MFKKLSPIPKVCISREMELPFIKKKIKTKI